MFRLLLVLQAVLCGLATVASAHRSVHINDVRTQVFNVGEMTTGRRSSPVARLTCVGGTARDRYQPQVVTCKNMGSDGLDATWECSADMDNAYRFGKTTVSCEGYEYPDDPYILAGSCGLEYTIDLTQEGREQHRAGTGGYGSSYGDNYLPNGGYSTNYGSSSSSGDGLVGLLIIGVVMFVVLAACCGGGGGGGGGRAPPPYGGGGGYGGGYGGGGGYHGRSGGGGGGGFWTGLAAGGILGNLAAPRYGSGNGYGYGYRNRNRGWGGGGGGWGGASARPSAPARSSGSRTATVGANTRRR